MPILPIIVVPNPVLKAIAQPIENINAEIKQQAQNMLDTMYYSPVPGVGLAANQVGILNRMFVMDVDYDRDGSNKNPIVMINPEIIWKSEELSIMEEGCLSIPNQYAEVERPKSVRVKFIDVDGGTKEMVVEGLGSHCVQHELDHLNGVLFIDYLSRLKRNMIMKRIDKMRRDGLVL